MLVSSSPKRATRQRAKGSRRSPRCAASMMSSGLYPEWRWCGLCGGVSDAVDFISLTDHVRGCQGGAGIAPLVSTLRYAYRTGSAPSLSPFPWRRSISATTMCRSDGSLVAQQSKMNACNGNTVRYHARCPMHLILYSPENIFPTLFSQFPSYPFPDLSQTSKPLYSTRTSRPSQLCPPSKCRR